MALGLNNPAGLWALLLIIPLIILYLIRPRPKKLEIPSLMFIEKTFKKIKKNSFLRRIIKDLLFLLQLLTLLFLLLVVSSPWIEISEDIGKDHTTLIIDTSASMHTKEGSKTRFEIAKDKAEKYLSSKNTIILIQNKPIIALKDGSKSQAENILNSLKSSETESNIGDAMILAGEITPKDGRIIVVSDFIQTRGTQPLIAKGVLESKDITTKLIKVGENGKKNFAIIETKIEEGQTKIFIKNYNKEKEEIKLQINEKLYSIPIDGNSIETYSFNNQIGVTKIEIKNEDDLPEDNIAYVSIPNNNAIKVLLVSSVRSKYLESALTSSEDIELEIGEPPVLPKKDYDVYIFYGINPENILAGTFEEIIKEVEEGKASVIIHAQKDIKKIDYGPLLPVKLKDLIDSTAVFQTELVTTFTKEINFGQSTQYFSGENRKGVKTLVSYDNNPIISMIKLNNGYLIYYGILEENSDFKLSPEYPIFWNRAIRYISNKKQIKDLNLKTGTSLPTGNEEIILDKIDTYDIGKNMLAVNLLNEKESEINLKETLGKQNGEFAFETTSEKVKREISQVLLWAALIIILLEFVYSKMRGEF